MADKKLLKLTSNLYGRPFIAGLAGIKITTKRIIKNNKNYK